MRFRDKNGPTLYPILQTAGFAGFFRRRAHVFSNSSILALSPISNSPVTVGSATPHPICLRMIHCGANESKLEGPIT